MPRLINPRKAEIPILPYLTALNAIDHHRLIPRGCELFLMDIVNIETNRLSTEPITYITLARPHPTFQPSLQLTNIIRIPIRQTNPHPLIKQILQIQPKIRIYKIPRILKRIVNPIITRVIQRNAQRLLHFSQIQILGVVRRGRGIVVAVPDIVHASAGVVVVRRLDVVATHVCGFVADLQNAGGELCRSDLRVDVVEAGVALCGCAAVCDLVEASVDHFVGEFGVGVDGGVVGFYAVGVVCGEFGVVSGLDGFVDDAVDYAEGVEGHGVALGAAVLDRLVLLVEVVEECGAVIYGENEVSTYSGSRVDLV